MQVYEQYSAAVKEISLFESLLEQNVGNLVRVKIDTKRFAFFLNEKLFLLVSFEKETAPNSSLKDRRLLLYDGQNRYNYFFSPNEIEFL